MGEDDPLRNADVGEKITVQDEVDIHVYNLEPTVFRGSDRHGRAEVSDIDIVEDEYGDQKIVVTLEGEVTKVLPRNWDYCREPLTETEKNKQRKRKWIKNGVGLTGVVGSAALASLVTVRTMNQLEGEVIEFGTTYSVTSFFVLSLLTIALAGGLMIYMQRMAKRRAGVIA